MDLFLREPPSKTVAELVDDLRHVAAYEVADLTSDNIRVTLTGPEQHVELRGLNLAQGSVDLPVLDETIETLARWTYLPMGLVRKLDWEAVEWLINHQLQRFPGLAQVHYDQQGLHEVRDPERQIVPLWRMADVAAKVIDSDAQVVDCINVPNLFRLDVCIPTGFHRGVGGDSQVGDITLGGITIEQDRRKNLAPEASTFLYRLECTNGMTHREQGDKLDARGQTVEQVLIELEMLAQRMFARVERQIAAFYDLRNEKVDNPDRMTRRLATEYGLPDRMVVALEDRAAMIGAGIGGDGASMYDIVNTFTNSALDPKIQDKYGVRRLLERIGGGIINTHAVRCPSCQHLLN